MGTVGIHRNRTWKARLTLRCAQLARAGRGSNVLSRHGAGLAQAPCCLLMPPSAAATRGSWHQVFRHGRRQRPMQRQAPCSARSSLSGPRTERTSSGQDLGSATLFRPCHTSARTSGTRPCMPCATCFASSVRGPRLPSRISLCHAPPAPLAALLPSSQRFACRSGQPPRALAGSCSQVCVRASARAGVCARTSKGATRWCAIAWNASTRVARRRWNWR
jgi:hypothetical protein